MNSRTDRLRKLVTKNPDGLGLLADAKLMNNISHELSIMRQFKGLTQKQLAEVLGVKQSNISRWEKPGYQGYKVNVLSKLARALGGSLQISLLQSRSDYTWTVNYTEVHNDSMKIEYPDGTLITKSSTRSDSTTISIPFQGGTYANK